jgi:hypothetical protein
MAPTPPLTIIPPSTRQDGDHTRSTSVATSFTRPFLLDEDGLSDESWTEIRVPAPICASDAGIALVVQESGPAPHIRHPEQRERLLALMRVVSSYHYLDDVGSQCFALAVAASQFANGPPLWGMLIGPSSGGKTTALDLVEFAAKERLDSLTMPGLLSWYRVNRQAPPVPGGTLVRIGDRGLAVFSDFSTILSDSNRGKRDDLFSGLRRIFDGRFQRDLGNEDKSLVWQGRVTFLAACTSGIDQFASHSDSLGPRWVYYRLAARERDARKIETRRALAAPAEGTYAHEKTAKGQANIVITFAGVMARSAERLSEEEHIIGAVEAAAQVACWAEHQYHATQARRVRSLASQR